MRRTLKHVSTLTGALMLCALNTSPAPADPYRWCAELSLSGDVGTNCYFMTLEQCRAAISGVGGFCRPNILYPGPASTEGSRHSRNRATR
jgi:hypothetical protein